MVVARTLACALLFFALPLLAGCKRGAPVNEDDAETEDVRKERRMRHEKMVPKSARPANPGAQRN